MPQFDTIIKNGTVVDGTRVPRYRADIGVKNGKIAKIGRLNSSDATKVVDANGLIVAPGFIDLHTHYDAQLALGPVLHNWQLAWRDFGRPTADLASRATSAGRRRPRMFGVVPH